jgi:hypothetical protein
MRAHGHREEVDDLKECKLKHLSSNLLCVGHEQGVVGQDLHQPGAKQGERVARH